MKLILLQDIPNIGKKFDVKEIKSGYARNFLIPKKLAKPANKETLAWLDAQKEIATLKEEEELKQFQEIATKVDGIEVPILVKVGEKDQLFEKITVSKIAEKLKELGFVISKNQIELIEPLTEIGEFPVKVKFAHNLEAEINLIISEEK